MPHCRSKRRHLMDEVSKRCNYLSPIKFISLKFSYIPVLFKCPPYRIHIFCLNHTKISTWLLREDRIQTLSIESWTFFAIELILPVCETHCFLPLLYDELHVLIMKLMSVLSHCQVFREGPLSKEDFYIILIHLNHGGCWFSSFVTDIVWNFFLLLTVKTS